MVSVEERAGHVSVFWPGDPEGGSAAMLRVDLAVTTLEALNDLLDEFRAEADVAAASTSGIVEWLAKRGVPAELIPLRPGAGPI